MSSLMTDDRSDPTAEEWGAGITLHRRSGREEDLHDSGMELPASGPVHWSAGICQKKFQQRFRLIDRAVSFQNDDPVGEAHAHGGISLRLRMRSTCPSP